MNRRAMMISVATIAALLLVACGRADKSISYRYRLTVEVDTPEGLKTGSSVIGVKIEGQQGLEGSHLDVRATGEAVAVDLPGGQTLFALLDKADGAAPNAIDPHLPELPNTADWWYQDYGRVTQQVGIYELPRTRLSGFRVDGMANVWPTLVHFRDIRDPSTVEQVDPDNVAATLGAGYAIKRITVQITDAPVTKGIEKRLGWFHDYINRHFDNSSTSTEDDRKVNISAHLSSGNFTTGFGN